MQQLSQFVTNPCTHHCNALTHVLRYLCGSSSSGLFYSSTGDFCLQAYIDVDWVTCKDTADLLPGFAFFLGAHWFLGRARSKPLSLDPLPRPSTGLSVPLLLNYSEFHILPQILVFPFLFQFLCGAIIKLQFISRPIRCFTSVLSSWTSIVILFEINLRIILYFHRLFQRVISWLTPLLRLFLVDFLLLLCPSWACVILINLLQLEEGVLKEC